MRGLLCSRCNRDLLGSAWDSLALVVALWHYMNTPPAGGAWLPPEAQPSLAPVESATRPSAASEPELVVIGQASAKKRGAAATAAEAAECTRPHYLPVGSESVPGKRGVWRVFVEPDGDPPF